MSLLQRVERMQQQQRGEIPAPETPTPGGPTPAEPTQRSATPGAPTMASQASAPKTPPVPDPGSIVPAEHHGRHRATAAVPDRAELLRQIRIALQEEAVGAFQSQLQIDETDIRGKVEGMVDAVLTKHGFAVTRDERVRLTEEVIDDLTGLGPLEPYLHDESITEVMVNGPSHMYIERAGKIQRVDSIFLNDEHVMRIIDRIITPMGRRIDESSPRVDARLADGSRVNAIIAPLSLIGPVITVRKFAARPYTVDDLIRFGTATPEMFNFLKACIEARLNVFVSGGTGSGKTTTLNVLSSFIPNDERIVTVEDAAELQLRQEHVVTLESRPPNLEGEGEITIRNLLRNAMHMRPDRIIVGECRAGEALDMLQAMTTGHDGSLSTGHANTPRDMLRRLETMVLMTGYEMPLWAIREQISSAVDLIVHQARLKDGSRKIVNITEVYGMEDGEVLTEDVFAFEQTGVTEEGKVEGFLKPTGFRPTFMNQFEANGIKLPPGEFGIPPEDPSKPPVRQTKSRRGMSTQQDTSRLTVGIGKVVQAGGMVYISSVGPLDPETGQVVPGSIKEQTQLVMSILDAKLKAAGSSLDKIVWANWALRDSGEFDAFNSEWIRSFPGDAPVGQETLMPPLQRRAGFRVSIGVIAEA